MFKIKQIIFAMLLVASIRALKLNNNLTAELCRDLELTSATAITPPKTSLKDSEALRTGIVIFGVMTVTMLCVFSSYLLQWSRQS